MTLNYYYLGKRIKDIRLKKCMSQSKLSELVDKSPAYISYIESGYKSMSLETLVQIANALEVSADMILGESILHPVNVDGAEFTDILQGCSPYEKRVIIDSARAVKQSMIEYKFLFKRNS